jgi:hypothetical protein
MNRIGEMERRMAEAYLGCDVWPGLGLRHSTFLLGLLSSLPTAKDLIRIQGTNGKIFHRDTKKKKTFSSFSPAVLFSSSLLEIQMSQNRIKDMKRSMQLFIFSSQICTKVEPLQRGSTSYFQDTQSTMSKVLKLPPFSTPKKEKKTARV